MIEVNTLKEAHQVPNLIHVQLGNPIRAWQRGDTLPPDLVPVPPTAEQLQQQRRVAAKAILNDPESLAIVFRGKVIADFKLFKTLLPTLTKAAYVKMITDEIDAGQADA